MARNAKRDDLVNGNWIWELDREHWTMLIEPHAAFFAKHGVPLDAKMHDSDWKGEVHQITIKHEDELPAELVEAFAEIVPLSKEEYRDEFLALAAKHHLDLGPHAARLTAAELAVRFYLHHREHFMAVYVHKFTSQPTNYSEFYDLTHASLDGRFTKKKLDLFKRHVGKASEDINGLDFSEVLAKESDVEVSMMISRGDRIRTLNIIRAETKRRERVHYIPTRFDTIHVEKGTGRLSINAARHQDVEFLRKLLGQVFFDNPEQFSATALFTAEPILTRGKDAVSCEGIHELEDVKVLGITLVDPTKTGRRRKFVRLGAEAIDYLDQLPTICAISHVSHVESVKLSLKLVDWKKELVITITTGNKLSVGKRTRLDVVYRFLKLRGFSIAPDPLPSPGMPRAA